MYLKYLRKLHYLVSIFLFTFCFFYIFSAGMLSMHYIFDTDNIEKIDIATDTISAQLSTVKMYDEYVQHNYNPKGKPNGTDSSASGYMSEYRSPVVLSKYTYNPVSNILKVERKYKDTFFSVIQFMHKKHGFLVGRFIDKTYGILIDITATAMIIFAITGVLIWFKIKKNLMPGILLLLCGTVTLICYLVSVY
ncbi:MAG: PepSY-associated TM helix domain-containing protein [Cytophagales bacterium]|nr:PepSY-associated TM helix domain-containing protein [Cytophagales bacterium]